jgi:hypothetical protein
VNDLRDDNSLNGEPPMGSGESSALPEFITSAVLPDGHGGFTLCPELMTEEELIHFLRIPEISQAKGYHNVIENLKRMHDLPRIHICGKPLYPREAIKRWIRERTVDGR